MRATLAVCAVSLFAAVAAADSPGIPGATPEQLAAHLRALLLKNLPTPLYEASPNWGHQSDARRLHFRGKLRDLRLEMEHEPRNDGLWRRIRVDAIQPEDNLQLELRNLHETETGRLGFQIAAALDVKFDIVQQRWLSGVKLLDVSARGRCRPMMAVDCDAAARWERGALIPELVIDWRITRAYLTYDKLKLDHVAGLGGEAAELIGDAAQVLIRQWKPSIERDLLAKASDAIVRAGQQKEVRLSLSKLLQKSP